ncbi:MAG: MFS transporter, partial [Actinomycetia bacterium]|nr:MFS transporter [Actinomycetes bacterium]
LTELFLTVSWAEHLAQHSRIDDASASILRTARAFDTGDGPTTTHLVAVDLEADADWDALAASHARYHADDGSIPLE